jgi:dephospho-CoA kinase
MLIGITGTDGAGKGTVVDYLHRSAGFVHYSSRDLISLEVEKRGLVATRENLRLVANDMRREHGDDVIVKKGLAQMQAAEIEQAIIESIRALAEATTLKASGGLLLAVDADPALRYKRITGRRQASDHISYEEFLAQEALEMNDPDPHGMQKAKVMATADFTIMNNTTFDELVKQIDIFLSRYRS